MTYQVLARKWRPQDFSSIIGQQTVVKALRNAVKEEKIAQAYLFAGIRGVGKTTAARVFAKAINCETRLRRREDGDGQSFEDPCNDCLPCREISQGSDLDVIEIDAATYSKVEQVRELTESLQYGPVKDRYKVVILDEVHRLSRQAFDALLKIVEEPPGHLVFIFATTEVEAVPATILSRCQEFRFRRVPAPELVTLLEEICEAENISATDRSLRLLARAGEGSVRDSVALLDQLATFGSGEVSDEDAARLLGGLDFSFFNDLLRAILAGASPKVCEAVANVEEQGWDPRRVHAQFLAYCRDGLHLAIGAAAEQLDLPADDAGRLADFASEVGYEDLLRLLHQLLKSEELIRRSDAPALAIEIAWLRAAELPKLVAIEEVIGSLPEDGEKSGTVQAAAPHRTPAKGSASAKPPSEVPGKRQAAEAAEGEGAARPVGPVLSKEPVEAFLELINQRKQPLAARLREATKLELLDDELRISIPEGDSWISESLKRQNNSDMMDAAVREIWGDRVIWKIVKIAATSGDEATEQRATKNDDPALEHPIVQSALDLFGGTIQSVERPAAKPEGSQ